jgi:hypothetical protein
LGEKKKEKRKKKPSGGAARKKNLKICMARLLHVFVCRCKNTYKK